MRRFARLVVFAALAGCLTKEEKLALFDDDADGFTTEFGVDWGGEPPWDCDDARADVYPGAPELCDGVDNDCDEIVDNGMDRTTLYADGDGDGAGIETETTLACELSAGWAAVAGDCDDENANVHRGATEVWYDGIDEDCAGGDDNDADGDGDASDDHAGTDCDDEDPTIYGGADEGWFDVGVDNNCDGAINEAVTVDPADLVRIDGSGASARFGTVITVVPPGWADTDEVVLIGAQAWESHRGAVYAWTVDDLVTSTKAGDATWSWEAPLPTGPFGDSLGTGIGWVGDEAGPRTAIGAMGVDGGRGQVYVLSPGDFDGPLADATLVVTGDAANTDIGSTLPSGTDLDGDGVSELIVNASLDSRVAAYAGTVGVFMSPASLSGNLSYTDADAMFTLATASGRLTAISIGDPDGDGADDLGFHCELVDIGGFLYTDVPTSGVHDAQTGSIAQFKWAAPIGTEDLDLDGVDELVTLGGIVRQYDWPVAGVVWPDDAVSQSTFADPAYVTTASAEPLYWGTRRIAVGSAPFDGARGAVAADVYQHGVASTYDDARFLVRGERAGDEFGTSIGRLDFDDNNVDDLVVGAPLVDGTDVDAGAVYLLPSPR